MKRSSMEYLKEILLFRRMISPILLQILFWAGIAGTIYGSYVLIKLDHWVWPFALILGILAVRVMFEKAILAFQTYERLGLISDYIKSNKDV